MSQKGSIIEKRKQKLRAGEMAKPLLNQDTTMI